MDPAKPLRRRKLFEPGEGEIDEAERAWTVCPIALDKVAVDASGLAAKLLIFLEALKLACALLQEPSNFISRRRSILMDRGIASALSAEQVT